MKSVFIKLLKEYNVDPKFSIKLWTEIETHYTSKKRHYHNLDHLEDLFDQLIIFKQKIKDWNVILFSLFYHDIIYKSTKNDNEEQSAKLASERMKEIGISESKIKLCFDQIIATKAHSQNLNHDTNYFTDADLSILGREANIYKNYCQKIRMEYSIYPDFLYNKGRKKVIQHFLTMESIFKTKEFQSKFEDPARQNLIMEMESLTIDS